MNEEQITKIESEEPTSSHATPPHATSSQSKTKKQKDPKKVAAGKALARKNAEARKILKQDEEISSPLLEISTIYNGIQLLAGAVGTGFTLYHGWNFYESYRKPTTPESPTPEPTKKYIRKSTEF